MSNTITQAPLRLSQQPLPPLGCWLNPAASCNLQRPPLRWPNYAIKDLPNVVKGLKLWHSTGPARDAYLEIELFVYTRLKNCDTISEGAKIFDPIYAIKLYMAGRKVSHARPCIGIWCASPGCLSKAVSAVTEAPDWHCFNRRYNDAFMVKAFLGTPTVEQLGEPSPETSAGEAVMVMSYGQAAIYGAPLYFSHETGYKKSVLGGLVYLGNEVFGLTTAHCIASQDTRHDSSPRYDTPPSDQEKLAVMFPTHDDFSSNSDESSEEGAETHDDFILPSKSALELPSISIDPRPWSIHPEDDYRRRLPLAQHHSSNPLIYVPPEREQRLNSYPRSIRQEADARRRYRSAQAEIAKRVYEQESLVQVSFQGLRMGSLPSQNSFSEPSLYKTHATSDFGVSKTALSTPKLGDYDYPAAYTLPRKEEDGSKQVSGALSRSALLAKSSDTLLPQSLEPFGEVAYSSSGDANDAVDWALIKITSVNKGLASRHPQDVAQTLLGEKPYFRELLDLHVLGESVSRIWLDNRGDQHEGSLDENPTRLKLPGSQDMIRVYEVDFPSFTFSRGDSGLWVYGISIRQQEVRFTIIGHIIAGTPGTSHAFIALWSEICQSIEMQTGERLLLPKQYVDGNVTGSAYSLVRQLRSLAASLELQVIKDPSNFTTGDPANRALVELEMETNDHRYVSVKALTTTAIKQSTVSQACLKDLGFKSSSRSNEISLKFSVRRGSQVHTFSEVFRVGFNVDHAIVLNSNISMNILGYIKSSSPSPQLAAPKAQEGNQNQRAGR